MSQFLKHFEFMHCLEFRVWDLGFMIAHRYYKLIISNRQK